VVHYIARNGESRVSKAAIISAVPPLMVQTPANPKGLPKKVFDDFQVALAANRSQFYRDVASGPFYNYNKTGKPSEATIENWWRQCMMGGAKAHYDGIVAFSQTDFTEDLKKITVPVLVMHSEDNQIVPYVASGPLSAKLLKNGTLKTYKGLPHGMPTTQAETINADLLAFEAYPSGHESARQATRSRPSGPGGLIKVETVSAMDASSLSRAIRSCSSAALLIRYCNSPSRSGSFERSAQPQHWDRDTRTSRVHSAFISNQIEMGSGLILVRRHADYNPGPRFVRCDDNCLARGAG
jgi:hypothetical protein